jgi:hypothetical protein
MATLARFVTPHSLAVEYVLDGVRRATSSDVVATMPINQLVLCIYRVLSKKGIVFDYEQVSLRMGQWIRPLDRVLSTSMVPVGNCLELAVTGASCLEAAHREPLIFQFVHRDGCSGHALLGYWLRPPSPSRREVVYRDGRIFSVRHPRNVAVLDVTGVSVNLPMSCFRACRTATALFSHSDWNLRFALDVFEARRRGIMPRGYPE